MKMANIYIYIERERERERLLLLTISPFNACVQYRNVWFDVMQNTLQDLTLLHCYNQSTVQLKLDIYICNDIVAQC